MNITEYLNPNPKVKKQKEVKVKRMNIEKTILRLIESMRPVQKTLNSKKEDLLFGRVFNDNESVYQVFYEHNLGPNTVEADRNELGFSDMLELQDLTANALIAAAKIDYANSLKEKA